jgi:hypothetical protein
MSARNRRLLLFGLPAGLLLLAVVGAWLVWPRTAITRENAAKIQPGTTLAEVEAILGGPARDESSSAGVGRDFSDDIAENEARHRDWLNMVANKRKKDLRSRSHEAVVLVWLDPDNRVLDCATIPVRPWHESLADLLSRWFDL